MAELFDKEQKLQMAVYIRNELKNYAYRAGFGNKIAGNIYVFETEESWSVSIPEGIKKTKLNVKKGGNKPTGIKLDEARTFFEQAIINGIKKYLATKSWEGKVTLK